MSAAAKFMDDTLATQPRPLAYTAIKAARARDLQYDVRRIFAGIYPIKLVDALAEIVADSARTGRKLEKKALFDRLRASGFAKEDAEILSSALASPA